MDSRCATDPWDAANGPSPGLPDSGAPDPATCQRQLELKSKLLENIGDSIIAHTFDGRIVYANERAAEMLGYAHSEFVNLTAWAWTAPDVRDQVPSHIEKVRRSSGLLFETRHHGRDGQAVHVETHARVVDVEPWGELVVCVSRDTAERSAAQETMRRLAFYDNLTGLSNRAMLENRLETALRGADEYGASVGVIYMDLDDFKPVNDTHGHAMGDRVLRIVGERLLNCVRDSDTVARVGGDEFIALFPQLTNTFELGAKARSIAETIAQPIGIDGVVVQVSVSVGLATYEPGEHHDELITRADHAMYRAKLHGREGWEEFLLGASASV